MKPFKIGVWIDNNNLPESGGGFSYTKRLIEAINLKTFSDEIEIYFIGYELKAKFIHPSISIPFKENYFIRKFTNTCYRLFSISLRRRDIESNYKNAIEFLKAKDIQLIFYPDPYVRINNYPYIVMSWDLGHKSTYAFPELSMNNQYRFRAQNNDKILNEALLICCESEQGKAEVIKYHQINPERTKVFPIFPSEIVEDQILTTKPNWEISDMFFFYPAQFWPHKNHYNLLLGFKHFLESNPNEKFNLIFTGSDKGNLSYIRQLIVELRLEDYVTIGGFVSNEELKWLYKNAVGLIFPTFLGPTNMPLLEAASLGCNIACSNLNGHIELLKEKSIYFEPTNKLEISNAFDVLLKKEKLKPSNDPYLKTLDLDVLENIFIESITIRKTWGHYDYIF